MAKKILTPEDSDLFHQTVGKVHSVKTDKVLLTPTDKPKPYPKPAVINVNGHLIDSVTALPIEKVGIEDSLSLSLIHI